MDVADQIHQGGLFGGDVQAGGEHHIVADVVDGVCLTAELPDLKVTGVGQGHLEISPLSWLPRQVT